MLLKSTKMKSLLNKICGGGALVFQAGYHPRKSVEIIVHFYELKGVPVSEFRFVCLFVFFNLYFQ